jgi:hypothetical protein
MKNYWQVKYYFGTHNNFGTDEKLLALRYYLGTHIKNIMNEKLLALMIILILIFVIFVWVLKGERENFCGKFFALKVLFLQVYQKYYR